jgi:hypothetical protein
MAHLSIHGIPIECSGSEWEPVELGELTRSLNGAPRSTKRLRRRDYRFTSDQGGLLLEEAEAVRGLICGDGHHLSFDEDLATSRTLLPYSVSATTVEPSYDTGKHGFDLFAEDGSQVRWAVGFTEWYTLLFWRYVSSAWRHYVVRRRNLTTNLVDVWENGVQTDVDPEVVNVDAMAAGDLVIDCNAGDELLDDVAALPFRVPDSWPTLMYAFHDASPWGSLPLVKASGPGVPSQGLTALGEVYTGRRVPMIVDGSPTVGEVFDFKLSGV